VIKYKHTCSKGHTFKKLVFGFAAPVCQQCVDLTARQLASLMAYESYGEFAARANVFLSRVPAVKRRAQVFAKPETSSAVVFPTASQSLASPSSSHIPYYDATPSYSACSDSPSSDSSSCSSSE
jgi:hypothetical protein